MRLGKGGGGEREGGGEGGGGGREGGKEGGGGGMNCAVVYMCISMVVTDDGNGGGDSGILTSLLNSATSHLTRALSKSSPPRNVSPLVDLTSNTPCWISKMEISNVPPPKS